MNLPTRNANKPLNILVLDDSPQWRTFLEFTLELELGILPTLAASGQEALEILELRPIDVVVTDLSMPGMNGVQFLGRAQLVSPGTKVIIMSGDFDVLLTTPQELVVQGAYAAIHKFEIASKLVNLLRAL